MHQLLSFLEDCFLIRTVRVETASERRRMVNPRKAYPVDPGLIPVCAELDDPATREREVRALLAAAVEHPHASLHLITLTPETAHGMPGQVAVHSAAQWFLVAESSESGT